MNVYVSSVKFNEIPDFASPFIEATVLFSDSTAAPPWGIEVMVLIEKTKDWTLSEIKTYAIERAYALLSLAISDRKT